MRPLRLAVLLPVVVLLGCESEIVENNKTGPGRGLSADVVPQPSPVPSLCSGCALAPVVFTRMDSQRLPYVREFAGDPAADYLLVVQDDGKTETAVEIRLNGERVVAKTELVGLAVVEAKVGVVLKTTNRLTVLPIGKAGAKVTVWMAGGTRIVDGKGATITAPGGMTLLIPPGALTTPAEIHLAGTPAPAAASPGITFVSPLVVAEPVGTTFATPAILTLPSIIDPTDPGPYRAYQYDPTTGALLATEEDVIIRGSSVSLPLHHFSRYIVARYRKFTRTPGSSILFSYAADPAGANLIGQTTSAEIATDLDRAVGQWQGQTKKAQLEFFRGSAANSAILVRFGQVCGSIPAFILSPSRVAVECQEGSRSVIVLRSDYKWYSTEEGLRSGFIQPTSPIIKGPKDANLESVLSHEFGHSLGLSHYNCGGGLFGTNCQSPPVMAAKSDHTAPMPLQNSDLQALSSVLQEPSIAGANATQIRAVSLTQQTGTPGNAVSGFGELPSLVIEDDQDRPVEGVTIVFYAVGAGGTVVRAVQQTDDHGTATLGDWLLGPTPGTYQVEGYAQLLARISFSVDAAVAGSALLLDGTDDYADVPGSAVFDVDALTVEAWVRLDANVASGQARIANRISTPGGTESWGLQLFPGNEVMFYSGNCARHVNLHSGFNLQTGRWYHLAGVNDATTLRVYVDGTEVASLPSVGAPCKPAGVPIVIGRSGLGPQFHFPGVIDEVRVWGVARSAFEIAANQRVRLAGNEPGLAGYWRFDEGSGTTAADGTGRGNHATLRNGAGWTAQTW